MRKKIKVIIDTNLWIHFLLSKKFDFIDRLLSSNRIQLVFCDELFTELTEVAARPKLKKFFTENEWKLILDIIDGYAVYVSVTSSVSVCRDEKDNFLLSLAKDAKADYLITGDIDLLSLKMIENTQIVTIAEYQRKMGY
jgi:putative PIN family toxin of toxin-antitoxin system